MAVDRQYILDTLLSIIACFSNKERQERAWIKGEGPWAGDFEEVCCKFFEIFEMIFDDGYKLYGISDEQYSMLKKFSDVIFDFPENYPPEFLETTEWQHIREMAKDIIDAFHYKDA